MTSFRNIFGKSSSLIVVGSCLLVLPASAEITTTTVTTTGDIVDSSGQVVGHVVKETTIKSDVYLETIDTRRFELEKVIAEGMATGKLNQTQADYLRSELDYVTKQEQAIKKLGGDTTPYEQIAVLAVRLDVVGQRLSDLVGYKLVPIVTNGRFVVLSGEVVQLDEIAMRRAELEGKISLALANSTLTTGQADNIRGQLDSIANTEVQFRGDTPSGEFTNEQARKLFTDFDRVASNLESDITRNHGNPVTTEPKK